METQNFTVDTGRYAHCLDVAGKINWDIDDDVIRGRRFDFAERFLPNGLSKVNDIGFLSDDERRLLSQIQGRTYANIFGLVERFIGSKVVEVGQDHALGDQVAFKALLNFADEELKHQELFRRIEAMIAEDMPAGYVNPPDPNAVAEVVLSKSTWAVLALTCHIELFTQSHYKESIEPEENISALYKDVFLHHWREESQHAVLDELEWQREDAKLSDAQRDQAVDDLISLVAAVDGILQAQAANDSEYFAEVCGRQLNDAQIIEIGDAVLKAYRWQYIVSGVQHPRFMSILTGMTTDEQMQRIVVALGPIVE